jgi:hypothetical protein
MLFVAKKLALDFDIVWAYQLHFNVWAQWWQQVMHIHMHLTSNK